MTRPMAARNYSGLISDQDIRVDIVIIFLYILILELLFRISFANINETAVEAFVLIFGLPERNVLV